MKLVKSGDRIFNADQIVSIGQRGGSSDLVLLLSDGSKTFIDTTGADFERLMNRIAQGLRGTETLVDIDKHIKFVTRNSA